MSRSSRFPWMDFGEAFLASNVVNSSGSGLARSLILSGFTMAIQAIGGYQADAADAVTVLTNLLSDSSVFSQTHAARALGQIGKSAAKALPELEKQLGDSESSVKEEIQKAIDSIKSAIGSEG